MTKRNIGTRANAKILRTEITPPEKKLWSILRGGRLEGIKFVRRKVFGPHYIADFAARSHKLVIELDGDSHAGTETYDAVRTAFIERKGYKIVRFANRDVFENPEGVPRMILNAIGKDWS